LKLGKLLGEGAFGMVVMGEAIGIGGQPGNTVVAVKMLKGMEKTSMSLLQCLELTYG